MGLFGKNKKESSAVESGTGNYVAPPVVNTSSSAPPQQQPQPKPTTPAAYSTTGGGPVTSNADLEVGKAPSEAPTSMSKSAAEKSAATPQVKNVTSPQAVATSRAEPAVPLASPESPTSFDEPSVLSGNTRGTARTYPTLRRADSDESKDSAFTITRNGQYLTLNGFANGHLMRWKFAAEEGPAFIKIPAVLLALGAIFTTVYPLVTDPEFWTIPLMICAAHTCLLCFIVCSENYCRNIGVWRVLDRHTAETTAPQR